MATATVKLTLLRAYKTEWKLPKACRDKIADWTKLYDASGKRIKPRASSS